ncbi:MAG: hypothetical protein LAT67_12400 [Balneolales bacterium]|nr:hypothetical protein [Balneolales bacterium]
MALTAAGFPANEANTHTEGSDGGHSFVSQNLNNHGYHVLSLAYFRADYLPEQLEEIPL